MAAWDGLSTETQIMILTLLPTAQYPGYLAAKVRDKALASDVPYIRYLSYRGTYLSRDRTADMEMKARLDADPDPLVRYSTKETEWAIADVEFGDPEKFLTLPHEARLAKVRLLKSNGDDVAKIISHALDNHLKDGRVSEIELYEVLADYVLKPSFRQHYEGDKWRRSYDGHGEYRAGKEIEALWNLVPRCPESLAHLLIEVLPPEAGLSAGIPADVIQSLTDHQLQTLLYRPDIALRDLRRYLFRDTNPDRDNVRAAAISSHFSIENSEFAEILALPDKETLELLRRLATYAGDLRLCVCEALHDYLSLTDNWEDAAYAEQSKERKLANLQPGWHRDEELRQLRLYYLARQAAPLKKDSGGYPPYGELEFLAEHVIKDDTWATFIAFEATWQSSRKAKALEKCLPRIDGVDPDDDVADIDDDANVDSELVTRVEHKLDQILAAVREKVDDMDGKSVIADALSKVAGDVTTLQEFASDDAKRIHGRISDLAEGIGRAINRATDASSSRNNPGADVEEDDDLPAHAQRVASEDKTLAMELVARLESSQVRTRRLLYVVTALLVIILLKIL
jgi:hypothetical protein